MDKQNLIDSIYRFDLSKIYSELSIKNKKLNRNIKTISAIYFILFVSYIIADYIFSFKFYFAIILFIPIIWSHDCIKFIFNRFSPNKIDFIRSDNLSNNKTYVYNENDFIISKSDLFKNKLISNDYYSTINFLTVSSFYFNENNLIKDSNYFEFKKFVDNEIDKIFEIDGYKFDYQYFEDVFYYDKYNESLELYINYQKYIELKNKIGDFEKDIPYLKHLFNDIDYHIQNINEKDFIKSSIQILNDLIININSIYDNEVDYINECKNYYNDLLIMEIPLNDVRYEMIYDLLDGIYDNKSAFIDVDIKELLNHIINN